MRTIVRMNPDRRAAQVRELRVRFGVAAVDEHDLADLLHQLCLQLRAHLRTQLLALLAVGHRQLHLDEFVVVQCALELGEHALAQAVACHGDHGVQRMADAAQLFLEFGIERHGIRAKAVASAWNQSKLTPTAGIVAQRRGNPAVKRERKLCGPSARRAAGRQCA